MPYISKCPFCKKESISSQIIIEDESFFVIHARRPLSRGHCLVIPKEHVEGIGMAVADGNTFIGILDKLFASLQVSFSPAGINFFANFGKQAGQEISHAHFHVVPRYADEKISPFKIINDEDLYKSREKLPADLMEKEIALIKNNFENRN